LYLASAIAQPTGGKLAEEFGPRRVFLIGILLVLAGGVVGGLARDLMTLTVARVLIGIGTSAGYPSAMLLIRRRAEEAGLDAPPGGVLGGLTISGSVTAAVGLPIGGVLVGALGWQATFFVNVPVALLTLAMAALWLPRDAPHVGSRTLMEIIARIDAAGILGFGGSLAALLVFLTSLPNAHWPALGVAVVIGIVCVGSVPNLWLSRLDRVLRPDLDRVSHACRRSRPTHDRCDHGERQLAGTDRGAG
jgi:MFS family permease